MTRFLSGFPHGREKRRFLPSVLPPIVKKSFGVQGLRLFPSNCGQWNFGCAAGVPQGIGSGIRKH